MQAQATTRTAKTTFAGALRTADVSVKLFTVALSGRGPVLSGMLQDQPVKVFARSGKRGNFASFMAAGAEKGPDIEVATGRVVRLRNQRPALAIRVKGVDKTFFAPLSASVGEPVLTACGLKAAASH